MTTEGIWNWIALFSFSLFDKWVTFWIISNYFRMTAMKLWRLEMWFKKPISMAFFDIFSVIIKFASGNSVQKTNFDTIFLWNILCLYKYIALEIWFKKPTLTTFFMACFLFLSRRENNYSTSTLFLNSAIC